MSGFYVRTVGKPSIEIAVSDDRIHFEASYAAIMTNPLDPFSNAQAVARYAEDPPRKVPGFGDLQSMTTLLLEEHAPEDARILVLGAGGGLELKMFAQANPRWNFDGVDPSREMLKLAEQTLGPLLERVSLQQGYIDGASEGPFDGATCLLTLHFLTEDERRKTVVEVRHRLKRGTPFVVAHASFPQRDGERARWLSRYAAFAAASGVEPAKAKSASAAIDKHLTILTPEQDETILREAGFSDISLFYVGFTFRGWVAYA
jgi:tRNA (cmo5U34)-methyltransferase